MPHRVDVNYGIGAMATQGVMPGLTVSDLSPSTVPIPNSKTVEKGTMYNFIHVPCNSSIT